MHKSMEFFWWSEFNCCKVCDWNMYALLFAAVCISVKGNTRNKQVFLNTNGLSHGADSCVAFENRLPDPTVQRLMISCDRGDFGWTSICIHSYVKVWVWHLCDSCCWWWWWIVLLTPYHKPFACSAAWHKAELASQPDNFKKWHFVDYYNHQYAWLSHIPKLNIQVQVLQIQSTNQWLTI